VNTYKHFHLSDFQIHGSPSKRLYPPTLFIPPYNSPTTNSTINHTQTANYSLFLPRPSHTSSTTNHKSETLYPTTPCHEPHLSRPRPTNSNDSRSPIPLTSTMTSTIKKHLTLPTDATSTCIVQHVFMSLFHDIAATFLLFTIINWVLDRVLNFFGPRWVRQVWVRVKIRQIRMGVGLMLGSVRDAMRDILVYIAKSILIFFEGADTEPGKMDKKKTMVKEIKKETHHYSTGSRSDGRAAGSKLKISLEDDSNRNWSNEHGNLSPDFSPPIRSTQPHHIIRNNTSSSRILPRPRGRDNSSWKRPRPNISNTPGSGVASSKSSPTVFTPSSTALATPGSSDVPHTPSTPVHTPQSTTSPSTVEMHTPESSNGMSFGGGFKLTGTELLTYGEYLRVCTSPEHWKAIAWCGDLRLNDRNKTTKNEWARTLDEADKTWEFIPDPSVDFGSSDDEDMASVSSSESESESDSVDARFKALFSSRPCYTPPPSASDTESEGESRRGTPTSTSSSGSGLMVVHTPPASPDLDSADESDPGTPSSTSSSGSTSTVIYTPPPMRTLDSADRPRSSTPTSTSSTGSGQASTFIYTPSP
jgi:hypothetical protein